MDVLNYTVKINSAAEGGYWAEVPALPGCFTQGDTLEEVTAMARDAIESYLSALIQRGSRLPIEKKRRKHFAFPLTVRAPRNL